MRNWWNTTHKSLSTVPVVLTASAQCKGVPQEACNGKGASARCTKCAKVEHSEGFMSKYLNGRGWGRLSTSLPLQCSLPFMRDQTPLAPLQMPQGMLLVFEPEQGMELIYSFNLPSSTEDISFEQMMRCWVWFCIYGVRGKEETRVLKSN